MAAAGATLQIFDAMSRFDWDVPLLEISTAAIRNILAGLGFRAQA